MKICGKPNFDVECVKIDVKQGSSRVMTQINEVVISFSLLSMKGLGCTDTIVIKGIMFLNIFYLYDAPLTHPLRNFTRDDALTLNRHNSVSLLHRHLVFNILICRINPKCICIQIRTLKNIFNIDHLNLMC